MDMMASTIIRGQMSHVSSIFFCVCANWALVWPSKTMQSIEYSVYLMKIDLVSVLDLIDMGLAWPICYGSLRLANPTLSPYTGGIIEQLAKAWYHGSIEQ